MDKACSGRRYDVLFGLSGVPVQQAERAASVFVHDGFGHHAAQSYGRFYGLRSGTLLPLYGLSDLRHAHFFVVFFDGLYGLSAPRKAAEAAQYVLAHLASGQALEQVFNHGEEAAVVRRAADGQTTVAENVGQHVAGLRHRKVVYDNLFQSRFGRTAGYGFGNALEALIGAIYLDLGFRACQQFVVRKVLPVLGSLEQISEEEVNFKSKLVEWCQKNHIKLEYTLKQREGTDDNAPLFVSKVLLENSMAGSGTGYSKKEAHQNASKEVLALLRRKPKYVQTIMKKRDERAPEEPTAKQAETVVEATPRRRRKAKGNTAEKPAETAQPSAGGAEDSSAGTKLPAEVKAKPTAVVKTPKKEKKVPQTVKPAGLPVKKEAPSVPAVVAEKPEPAARKSRRPKPENRSAEEKTEDKRREDIIRQAEEAAFAEHTD